MKQQVKWRVRVGKKPSMGIGNQFVEYDTRGGLSMPCLPTLMLLIGAVVTVVVGVYVS